MSAKRERPPRAVVIGFAWLTLLLFVCAPKFALGQETDISDLARTAAYQRSHPAASETPVRREISLLALLENGGVFMIPIAVLSLVVVTFIFDRAIGLRSGKHLPGRLRKAVGNAIRSGDQIDPRILYREASNSNSAAARIVRDALTRAGRPQSEIAAAVAESTQREVDKAYANVRWLSFAAGVGPLLGLLGTVWGLIRSFHDTTFLAPGQSRADSLTKGIYEALVTTLAGLLVAIPAALAAHYFEGRVTKIFSRIQDLASELVRALERFEGKTRFDTVGRELVSRDIAPPSSGSIAPPPVVPMLLSTSDPPKPKISRATKS